MNHISSNDAQLRRRMADLNIISEYNLRFSSTLDLSAVKQALFEALMMVTGAEVGAILLAHEKEHRCQVYRSAGSDQLPLNSPIEGCPLVEVMRGARTLHWAAGGSSSWPMPNCAAQVGQVNSYLGMPLMAGGAVIGAVEAINLAVPENLSQQAELLAAIAAPASLAIRNALLYQQLEAEKDHVTHLENTVRRLFSTYLPQQVADMLVANPEQARPGGEEREVTILFADLQGFTSLAETLPLDDVVSLLNRVLTGMAQQISLHGGVIDKFLGDGLMAIFNSPTFLPQHASIAARAALAIEKYIANQTTPYLLKVNMGIHTGKAIVGNIGGTDLLSYTAVGDTVNVAKRIQDIAHDGQILVSASVYERIQGEWQADDLGEQYLTGRRQLTHLYRLVKLLSHTHTPHTGYPPSAGR